MHSRKVIKEFQIVTNAEAVFKPIKFFSLLMMWCSLDFFFFFFNYLNSNELQTACQLALFKT